MTTQSATLSADVPQNARNYSGDKELIDRLQVVTYDQSQAPAIIVVVDARIWMGRSRSSSVAYASIWVHPKGGNDYRSGAGKAGGYGYHRASAALQEAIASAGITLAVPIDGAGDSAMRAAVLAIARAAGYPEPIPLEVV